MNYTFNTSIFQLHKLFYRPVDGIGALHVKDVIVEFDHPLIFVCEDDHGSLYLFHETADDGQSIEWQAVEISRQTCLDLLASRISLSHVFRDGQPKSFLLVRYQYGAPSAQVEVGQSLQCGDILECKETFASDFSPSPSRRGSPRHRPCSGPLPCPPGRRGACRSRCRRASGASCRCS